MISPTIEDHIYALHGDLTTMQEYQDARNKEGDLWYEFVAAGKAVLCHRRRVYALSAGAVLSVGMTAMVLAIISSAYTLGYIIGGVSLALTAALVFRLLTRTSPAIFNGMSPTVIGLQEYAADYDSFDKEMWECAQNVVKGLDGIYDLRFDDHLNQVATTSMAFSLDNAFRVRRSIGKNLDEAFYVQFIQRDLPRSDDSTYYANDTRSKVKHFDLIDTRTGEPVQPV